MNRLHHFFTSDKKQLSVYFTAGFPKLNDTVPIILELEKSGVDFIEIGLPFSDPLADGPVIQKSSTKALENGMTTNVLFKQLESIREKCSIPLLIMGYFNNIYQFGIDNFCKKCAQVGIDGVIIPDMPLKEFEDHYKTIFESYQLATIFLVTPQTPVERIHYIDGLSSGFIYLVSSSSTTGAKDSFSEEQLSYFKRIEEMNLKNPIVTGFGISNKTTFAQATQFTSGAIIGSAFIKHLQKEGVANMTKFSKSIR